MTKVWEIEDKMVILLIETPTARVKLLSYLSEGIWERLPSDVSGPRAAFCYQLRVLNDWVDESLNAKLQSDMYQR